jgi:hypothetical protein
LVKREPGLTSFPRVQCVYMRIQSHGEREDHNGQLGHQSIAMAMKPQLKAETVSRERALQCGCQSKQPNDPVVESLQITSLNSRRPLAKHRRDTATKKETIESCWPSFQEAGPLLSQMGRVFTSYVARNHGMSAREAVAVQMR